MLFTTILLGGVVGFILALTGAGGTILAVPFLIFGLGLGITEAAPIALLAAGLSAAVGSAIGLKAGKVRYRAALLIAGTGMVIAPIGVWIAHHIPQQWLTIIFAIVLGYVAINMLRNTLRGAHIDEASFGQAPCKIDTTKGRLIWTLPCAWVLATSGVLAGFLSGLLGVGGGFIILPALKKASNLDMDHIVPTSLAVITLVSISGVIAALISGQLNWGVASPFAIGSVSGMVIGRLFARQLSGPLLLKIFSVFTLCIAAAMMLKVML